MFIYSPLLTHLTGPAEKITSLKCVVADHVGKFGQSRRVRQAWKRLMVSSLQKGQPKYRHNRGNFSNNRLEKNSNC
jgi:hypothetical protein